ncbi:hypothetical protein NC651_020294 [Populus alba x Populus x berolinensis]|nr:hypothetical protein NC651_020276 [Populus alba x Populus x berolinensis]KAJ6902766.1 hypothetical protein NC651_020294 [Populus alba x Populus x berolinensis]
MAMIMEILLTLVNACLALIDNENHLTRIGLFLGIWQICSLSCPMLKGYLFQSLLHKIHPNESLRDKNLLLLYIITPKENDCFSSKLQSWLIRFETPR